MYVSMGTRPDITFATSTVAQFMDNPASPHWEAVKHIFQYLKGTKNLELVYGGVMQELEGYVDADGASQDHRRAISGYVFMVDNGAVSWSSKKQELVTLSTMEAEYVAATHAAKEAIWFRCLIGDVLQTPTKNRQHFMATTCLQSHSLTVANTTLVRNTSIFAITLSVTSSMPAALNSSTVLLISKLPIPSRG